MRHNEHGPIHVLKAAMQAKGWTNHQLAEMSGVHQSLIGRYLAGEVDVGLKNAIRLARVLGVEVLSIVGAKYAA